MTTFFNEQFSERFNNISQDLENTSAILSILSDTSIDSNYKDIETELDNISQSITKIANIVNNGQIDYAKYQKLIDSQQKQRTIMKRIYPMYFCLNQNVSEVNHNLDSDILP